MPAYVKAKYNAQHAVVVVPLCGHNARCMFTSESRCRSCFRRFKACTDYADRVLGLWTWTLDFATCGLIVLFQCGTIDAQTKKQRPKTNVQGPIVLLRVTRPRLQRHAFDHDLIAKAAHFLPRWVPP